MGSGDEKQGREQLREKDQPAEAAEGRSGARSPYLKGEEGTQCKMR